MKTNFTSNETNPFTDGLIAKDIIAERASLALEYTNAVITNAVNYIKENGDKVGAAIMITGGVLDAIGTVFVGVAAQPDSSFAVSAKQAVVTTGIITSLGFLGVGIRQYGEALNKRNKK